MNRENRLKAILIGFVTGMLLALSLKAIQHLTGDKVYTLLLNVDYFPVLKDFEFSEPVEVLFHLIVSIILCMIIAFFYIHNRRFFSKNIVLSTMLLNTVIGLLLFPTTSFSNRTPELTDGSALCWWLAGHAVYGLALGFFIQKWFRQKESGRN